MFVLTAAQLLLNLRTWDWNTGKERLAIVMKLFAIPVYTGNYLQQKSHLHEDGPNTQWYSIDDLLIVGYNLDTGGFSHV